MTQHSSHTQTLQTTRTERQTTDCVLVFTHVYQFYGPALNPWLHYMHADMPTWSEIKVCDRYDKNMKL